MYRRHIVKASSVSRKKLGRTVSVAEVPLVGKGLKTEQCGRPHDYLIMQTARLGK